MASELDQKIQEVEKRIQTERMILEAAQRMPANQDMLRGKVKEANRNISYFEQTLRELQMRKMQQSQGGPDAGRVTSPSSSQGSGLPTSPRPGHQHSRSSTYGSPGGLGDPSSPDQSGFSPGTMPKPKQYSNFDLIRADTPHTTAKISKMLELLEFKLTVEKQYQFGIDKMAKLYEAEGDKRSRQDAEAKKIESDKKIQLLQTALKRYKTLHVLDSVDEEDDMPGPPAPDGDRKSNMRAKPLSGKLQITLKAARELEHAPVVVKSRTSSKQVTDTYVTIKVEGNQLARSHPSRTDRWLEDFEIPVDKANEVEITVYDKQSSEPHPVPIGFVWVKIGDLAEALRRQKVMGDVGQGGWMTANAMGGSGSGDNQAYMPGAGGPGSMDAPLTFNNDTGIPPAGTMAPGGVAEGIDAWFAVEPAGSLALHLNFVKENVRKRPMDAPGGLGRQGAVRKRKDEVHEMNGHKFVQRQFYQIILCAFCSEFLLNAVGYQCEDCRYTCHKKCYEKVVTKCVSKSSAGDEETINMRIPHRFEPITNMSANWCCHCGYMLPLGRKNVRKCMECGITSHADCAHLVPNFCGMSMERASQLLSNWREINRAREQGRQGSKRPTRPPSAPSTPQAPQGMGALNSQMDRMQIEPSAMGPAPTQDGMGPPTTAQDARMDPRYQQQPLPSSPSQSPQMSSRLPPGARMGPPPSYDGPPPGAMQPQRPYGADPASQGQAQPPPPPSNDGYGAQQGPYRQLPPRPGYPAGPGQSAPASPTTANRPLIPPDRMGSLPSGPAQGVPPSVPPAQQSLPPQAQQQRPPPQQPQQQQRPPARKRKVGLDDFNFLAVLGKGNFGKVMLAEEKRTNGLYAIKVLKKEFIIDNDEVESTRSEKRVFMTAAKERHPFLLGLHSCFQTETRVYFVMEYVSGGDLMLHIQRKQFSLRQAKYYACEVLLALEYFHANGIVYRDLKLDNILLTTEGHVKVADYGLCKEEMWFGQTTSTFCGTPEFMAPEILLEQRYGRAVDWWAFGVLMYEMLLGQSPFRGDDEDEIFDAILEDEPLYPITMPRDAVSILQKLLTRDPLRRLGAGKADAEEIKKQPFFKDVNWDDVFHKRIPPPYKPTINGVADTSNFDEEFTKEQPTLTPVHGQLSARDQAEFNGFSWVASWADL